MGSRWVLQYLALPFFLGYFSPVTLLAPEDTPALSIRTTTKVCLSPCLLTLTVVVPQHLDNRRLDVAWASPDQPTGGAFSRDISGPDPDVVFTRDLRLVGGGTWILGATLTQVKKGKVRQVSTEAFVEVR